MDLNKLRSFCRVYEFASFSRAAQELFLSQPTISAHVHSLELELETLLFDRLGRSVLPTQAGRMLYLHAKQVLQQLEKAVQDVHLVKDQVAGDLYLGGSTIPGNYLLPRLMHSFKTRHPKVSLYLELNDTLEIANRVQEGGLDLGVIGAQTGHFDLEFLPVMQDELVVVGLQVWLGSARTVNLQTLFSLPWVLREQGSGTRIAWQSALAALGKNIQELQVSAVVHSTNAMLKCVLAGLGVAVTSRLAAKEFLDREEMVSVQAPELCLQRSFFAVRHKQRDHFPAAQKFWQLLSRDIQG